MYTFYTFLCKPILGQDRAEVLRMVREDTNQGEGFLSINIALFIRLITPEYQQIITNPVDTEQPIESLDQSDELRLRNAELKKELEREKMLHKMLFKEWEELTAEMAAHKQDGYENSRPKNLFYKYAFYVLLITLLPVFYFLNPLADNKRPSSFQTVSDTVRPANASETRTSATRTNTLPVKDSASAERIFLSIGFEINSNSAGYEATRVSHFVLIIASHTFCLLPICKAQKKVLSI